MSSASRAGAVLGVVAGAHLLPSVLTIPAVHRRLAPRLSGASGQPHVALTFDDGPDPDATPRFLDALAELDVHATFFVLGSQLDRYPELAKRVVGDGHEIAVHGWAHTPHLLRAPWRIRADLARTYERIVQTCGATPTFWRPPNGIITGAGLHAARSLGLTPALWTADGQDWRADATPDSITDRVTGRLRAGGVVLLHDSDITSAPGSWRATLAALPALVAACRRADWSVGPLHEHWG
jgi:peptidoglycan-N-acetylglucosamine deacetylase